MLTSAHCSDPSPPTQPSGEKRRTVEAEQIRALVDTIRAGQAQARREGTAYRFPRQPRTSPATAGTWECEGCNALNGFRRSVCWNCQQRQPIPTVCHA